MVLKKKTLGMIFLITLLVLSLQAPFSLVYADKPLTVGLGKQYSTISEAVLASNLGDKIHVYSGIYSENVVIKKDGLKIIGVEGAEITILDGTGVLGSGIYIEEANDVTIQGLTITEYNFGIFLIRSERCTIKDNIIHNIKVSTYDWDGTGIFVRVSCHENQIVNNVIYECGYFGVYVGYTRESGTCIGNVIKNNKIYDNSQGISHGSGIRLRNADYTIIMKNEIYGHVLGSYPYGIILRDSCDYNKVQNNYIHDNTKSIMIYRTSRYNKVQNNYLDNNDVNYVELLDPELSIGNIIKNN